MVHIYNVTTTYNSSVDSPCSVRPPKKSWKVIANLSGGEKTLSSLSLVFALHQFKPNPPLRHGRDRCRPRLQERLDCWTLHQGNQHVYLFCLFQFLNQFSSLRPGLWNSVFIYSIIHVCSKCINKSTVLSIQLSSQT